MIAISDWHLIAIQWQCAISIYLDIDIAESWDPGELTRPVDPSLGLVQVLELELERALELVQKYSRWHCVELKLLQPGYADFYDAYFFVFHRQHKQALPLKSPPDLDLVKRNCF